jgi:ribosomal protein S27E
MISRAERVAFGMRNSECFIPILTVHGSVSRTVNQEVGLARGLDRLIIPLQEEGSEMPFLISHLQPIIFYSEVHDSYQDAIGKLIETLRDLTRLEWLKVICPSCGEEMTQYLTPQEEVDRSLMHGSFLETICSYCERPISLDPRTFKALP